MDTYEVGIGFGSNIGDKIANIAGALALLTADGRVQLKAMSKVYRTAPWGNVAQDFFANACAIVETALPPLALLAHAKAIEVAMGREHAVRWGPRLIDIDILFYGSLKLATVQLTLPHLHLFNRGFVLIPLAEIAPDMMIDGQSIARAAAQMEGQGVTVWTG